ncbi:MAG TPA: hypothetical protein VGQ31_11000 [Candidatus Limnocylindrales bacterium]|jgi:hypothetical protein|nr:hypothetical protein [Candidatus Limnocylindrales bacterium]
MSTDRARGSTDSSVIAVTADDDRFAASRRAAMDLAENAGAELILYDWESPMLLGDPLPSVWSADGTDTAVPDRLDEKALEAAGRAAIAQQVGEARAAGLRASGWLPSERGADALFKYAQDHKAIGIVIPADLKGSLEASESTTGIQVLVR